MSPTRYPSPEKISETVRAVITEHIDSVPELEAILLLRRARDREWTADAAGARLYVSTTVAEHLLAALTARGFFASTPAGYRYAPATTQLEAAVDALAAAYSEHLVTVTHLIHSKPRGGVRQFAEAFDLRKDK
jgi:hypothetical protein